MLRKLLLVLLAASTGFADQYLFTSFRSNGETGVFLALSRDGRKWQPLNGNQAWLKPEHQGMLMRDPWLGRGPDGLWHLLWTWGWNRKETNGALKIGHATTKDLIHWSPQQEIQVFAKEPTARNAWAPEAAWDEDKKQWVIFWSTTIPGRFPDTEGTGDSGYNHRMYAIRTKDWKSFSEPELWFDPGFNCIDGTVAHVGNKKYVLIFKDERVKPQVKRLRLAFGTSPEGPWSGVTEPFTHDWVEGPSAIQINQEWWIYFDNYRKPTHYGAVRTRDWKSFEDMSDQVSFPEDHRHGTVVRITDKEAEVLQKSHGAE